MEAQDNEGWTALHFATENNHVSTVQLLVNAGADMEAQEM
jgi:ankyrin repeat protein